MYVDCQVMAEPGEEVGYSGAGTGAATCRQILDFLTRFLPGLPESYI